jgi:hypothetical protein
VKSAVLISLAAVFVAGCMEVEQTVTAEQRQAGSTVKRDTAAWNNEPLASGPKWTKGDRNSWEEQIKKRQLTQNESVRIGN